MSKLTIFWGDKSADKFYWQAEQSLSGLSFSAVPELDSHEILKADLACIADMADSRRVELVLSCNDIHFNKVNLPNKAQRHIRKAVPYIIEEQISEPIDSLFIAVGTRSSGDLIPVRGINKGYLDMILSTFKAAEVQLDSIRIDLDLVEECKDEYRLVLFDDLALVVDNLGNRWSCDVDDFSWLAQRQLEENSEDELPIAIPMEIVCQSKKEQVNFENQLPAGRFAPEFQVVESVEAYLFNSNEVALNLLQGEYEPKVENSPLKSMLQKVATIAAIVFVANLIYLGSQSITLKSEYQRLGKERAALWKQAFPGRKVPSSPDKVLRSFMKSIGGGKGDSSFLLMLDSVSSKLTNLKQLYPTNISYNAQRNELRIDLVAKDLPILNQYRDALKQSGFDVDMSSANQRGDGYSSRLIVRK